MKQMLNDIDLFRPQRKGADLKTFDSDADPHASQVCLLRQ